MKRIRLFMAVFFVCLCVPLWYFILRTHQSLDQEEMAELRYFGDTLFYEMEKTLAELVLAEEGRAIDDYTGFSELSKVPEKEYILGYFQNNPDGSFLTPLSLPPDSSEKIADMTESRAGTGQTAAIIEQLQDANEILNSRRMDAPEAFEISPPEKVLPQKEEAASLAGRYLDLSRDKQKKTSLGQESKRVEEITADQAIQLSKQDMAAQAWSKSGPGRMAEAETDLAAAEGRAPSPALGDSDRDARQDSVEELSAPAPAVSNEAFREAVAGKGQTRFTFRVEVDPLQSVVISDEKLVFFRRIVIENQVYRQGFVILARRFLDHLLGSHFSSQPMAAFTRLSLSIEDSGQRRTFIEAGAPANDPRFTLDHRFPRPFAFLNARLTCDTIPRSPGRRTVNIMMILMAGVILLGFFAIYRSVRAIVGLSERRSRFVSAVTHELKTPLTNIRMYVEMLEQGIAATPERERDYFRILGSESSRLSRLINNVLEYAKLEKKNRRMEMADGNFEDVVNEVKAIMAEKLRMEGFALSVENPGDVYFPYDRDAMVQVLINLIENSLKFGKHAPEKKISLRVEPDAREVKINLSDTGPGIPKQALKKIFDDFFRVDNELTRTTGGTGIGLALVSRFVRAMGGRVAAKNNAGPGCTISICLPRKSLKKSRAETLGR